MHLIIVSYCYLLLLIVVSLLSLVSINGNVISSLVSNRYQYSNRKKLLKLCNKLISIKGGHVGHDNGSNGNDSNGSNNDDDNDTTTIVVDEQLYSRQLLVLGKKGQQSIQKAHVLIKGVGPLTSEIVKNLAMAGIGKLSITENDSSINSNRTINFNDNSNDDDDDDDDNEHNDNNNEDNDIEEQSIFSSKSWSIKGTARSLVDYATTLNPNVKAVAVPHDIVIKEGEYSLVICADTNLHDLEEVNSQCRNTSTMMIGSNVNGVSGFIFNDLLPSFEVNDCDGEETKNIPLLKAQFISNDDKSTIRLSCIDEEQLKLGLGDTVEIFCDVSESISDSIVLEVNKVDTTKTVVAHAKGSDISDATIEMINSGKALARKAKKSKIIDYKSLKEQLLKPTFMSCNGCLSNKQDRALNVCLLAAFKAIDKYDFSHSTGSDNDVDNFKEKIIEELNELGVENPNQSVKAGGVGEDTLTKVARGFLKVLTVSTSARCYSTVSVIGSLVSQETIKVLTRVHTPIDQLLLFESLDSIVYDDNNDKGIGSVDLDMFNSINVYGRELARELAHMKVFVVGSGAIGCELLKTFALMGIGIGNGKETDTNSDKNLWTGLSKGGIVLTDMDHIEVILL